MPRHDLRSRLDASLKLKSVQGLLAFAISCLAYFVIAVSFYQYDVVGQFIFNNLTYVQTTKPWLGGVIDWVYASSLLTSLIMTAIMVALVTALLIIVFRWLGLKTKWPVTKQIVLWSLIANAVVFAINYGESFVSGRDAGVILQTLVGYAQLLLLGLPYTFAWLWATRGQKALDLRARKR